tara:strand:+ start:1895 stop:3082 length:1188 start_codon:yes stop_codon:yes gene_type:complete
MKPIFTRGLPLQVRLILAIIFSLLLLVARNQIEPARSSLSSILSPLQCAANTPSYIAQWMSNWLENKENLEQQNHELLHQQLMMSERLQKLEHLHQENIRLRSLLGSQERLDARKIVAEVMAVASDRYHHYIVLQVGQRDGIYEGQTVIDSKGIIGQVTQVGALTSRVLLISDLHHAIPVRVARSDVRSIAYGTGEIDELELRHLPVSTDVKKGDLIVSSGLGGRFPEGYPVARISHVEHDSRHRYAVVTAKPIASLDRVRYLLLLWPGASPVLKSSASELNANGTKNNTSDQSTVLQNQDHAAAGSVQKVTKQAAKSKKIKDSTLNKNKSAKARKKEKTVRKKKPAKKVKKEKTAKKQKPTQKKEPSQSTKPTDAASNIKNKVRTTPATQEANL